MDQRRFQKPLKPRLTKRGSYSHHKTFGASIVTLLAELIKLPPIVSQGAKPDCTAAGSVTGKRMTMDQLYGVDEQWNEELIYAGVSDAPDGFSLDVPANVCVKVGYTPTGEFAPTDKMGAYFFKNSKIAGLDWFDSIRQTQFQLYQQTGKIYPFYAGINWYQEWENAPQGFIPNTKQTLLGGHFIVLAGWKTFPDGVVRIGNPNTWGTSFGDNGVFWFDRESFNANIGQLGVYYLLEPEDTPPEIRKLNIIEVILQNIKAIFQILIQIKQQPAPIPPVPPQPPEPIIPPPAPTQPPVPVPSAYSWGNPEVARHSVRLIADEIGLTLDQKNLLCQVIACESGFNIHAINENKDTNGNITSTDNGICQWNSFFHGKEISPDQAMNDPEKAVRLMCNYVKQGLLRQCVCFSSKKYKKYPA